MNYADTHVDKMRKLKGLPPLAELVEVEVFRGEDGAMVVQIDTGEGFGHLRVNVNDAPVFDQDPEQPSRINYAALDRSL